MAISFQTNKNIVLLYALLNHFGQALGPSNTTKLREEMVEKFKQYKGPAPDIDKYIHPSKGVQWSLTVGNPPNFEAIITDLSKNTRRNVKAGEYLKPYLVDFYNKTNFEKYYSEVEPRLQELTNAFKIQFENINIEEVLTQSWQIAVNKDLVVIPNPFTQGNYGPKIGDIHYQIIGIWHGRNFISYIHNIIHEASHPLAKEILVQFTDLIDSRENLMSKIAENEKFDKAYNTWQICFEEHLIRAVHKGIIAPKLINNFDEQKALQLEIDQNGMIFIKDFYEVLRSVPTVVEAIPMIIKNLDKYEI